MKELDSILIIKDNHGSSFISPPKGSDFSELERYKELLISSALRNILFQTDLDTKHLADLKITRRIRDVLLNDCEMYDKTNSHVNAGGVIEDLIENIPIVDNIELSKEELNYFFIRAIQYAVPRQSYIVGVAKEWAEEYLEELTK